MFKIKTLSFALMFTTTLAVFLPKLHADTILTSLTEPEKENIHQMMSLIVARMKSIQHQVTSFAQDENGITVAQLIEELKLTLNIIETGLIRPVKGILEEQEEPHSSLYYDFLLTADNLFTEIHKILYEVLKEIQNAAQKKMRGKHFLTKMERTLKSFKKPYENIDSCLALLSRHCTPLGLPNVRRNLVGLRSEMSKAHKTAKGKIKTSKKLLWSLICDKKLHC